MNKKNSLLLTLGLLIGASLFCTEPVVIAPAPVTPQENVSVPAEQKPSDVESKPTNEVAQTQEAQPAEEDGGMDMMHYQVLFAKIETEMIAPAQRAMQENLFKIFVCAWMGGFLSGEVTPAKCKEAFNKGDVYYFLRVIPATGLIFANISDFRANAAKVADALQARAFLEKEAQRSQQRAKYEAELSQKNT